MCDEINRLILTIIRWKLCFQFAIAKMVAILNVGFLGSVIALTLLAVRDEVKLNFVGLVCTGLTIGMYASPLSVMVCSLSPLTFLTNIRFFIIIVCKS